MAAVAQLANFRLKVFRTVAESLSFRRAGEELYLTQPAVTLQIKTLEEDLGVPLFDRTGRQIALTPAGTVLLECVGQIDRLLTAAEQEIAGLRGEVAGELRIGVSTTIAQYVLPRMLGEFHKKNPQVRLALAVGTTVELARALWIVPVSVATAAAKRSKAKIQWPWFIALFCLAALANTHLTALHVLYPALQGLGKTGLTVTLFLIGTGISKETLRRVGARPLAQGVFLWTIVSVSSLLMIRFGWIHL